MIRLNNVSKSFGEKHVLRDFSLTVDPGERVCLTGASGCGKSTVLAIASGRIKPDSGSVMLCENIRISYLFQEDRLLPWLSALENMTAAGIQADRAMEMLDRMGLASDYDKRPEQLSGGMKRRLAIARALAFGGDVFFLDEPLQGLDPDTAQTVTDVMLGVLRGRTALMVSHSETEINALATRVVPMVKLNEK